MSTHFVRLLLVHTHSKALPSWFTKTRGPSQFCRKGKYDSTVKYLRKLGIYSYRADFLPKFLEMPASNLQQSEDLEQNKVIEAGYKIKVAHIINALDDSLHPSIAHDIAADLVHGGQQVAIVPDAIHGVDTPEQLADLNEKYFVGNERIF